MLEKYKHYTDADIEDILAERDEAQQKVAAVENWAVRVLEEHADHQHEEPCVLEEIAHKMLDTINDGIEYGYDQYYVCLVEDANGDVKIIDALDAEHIPDDKIFATEAVTFKFLIDEEDTKVDDSLVN